MSDRSGVEQRDPFRILTVVSAAIVGVGYLLPWADIDGPAQPVEGGEAVVNVTEQFEGSVSAYDISLFPELVVGIAIAAVLVAAFSWTFKFQFVTGVLGLVGAFIMLVLWAYIDAEGGDSLIEIGSYAGIPSAFEPAPGLWISMVGTLGIVICAFAGATREYVQHQEED